ncbi:MAG: hypothetical protein L0H70_10170 [Xanthomonadales bacterium]|nr:hypothetical protein [Xanthomonadales bacterium]
MSATVKLFEAYKESLGITTDCGAADKLGVKNQTVNNWRTRGSQAQPYLIQRMTSKLGLDAAEWTLRAQMQQSPDNKNKQAWKRVAKQFGFKIALVAVPTVATLSAHLSGATLGMI